MTTAAAARPAPPPGGASTGVGVLARSALAYLPSRLVPAALGILLLPLLGRALTPAEFGSFALVMSSLPFVALATGDWLLSGYQRRAHLGDPVWDAQAGAWLLLVTSATALTLLATAVATGSLVLAAVALLVVPHNLLRLQWTRLHMDGQGAAYSRMQVLYSSARALTLIATALHTHRVLPVLGAWLAVLWGTVLVGKRMSLRGRPRLDSLRALAVIGLPLIAVQLATNLLNVTDRFVISALEGRAATGVYSFGYLLGENLLALPGSVLYLAAYALTARAWDGGESDTVLRLTATLLRGQAACACVAVAVLVPLAGPLLELLAPAYSSAGPVLVLAAAAQIPAGAATYLVLVATLAGRARRTVAPAVAAAVVNLAITVPAVWLAGPVGAAVGTVVSYLLYLLLLARSTRSPLLTHREWGALLVGTGAPLAAALLPGSLWLAIATAASLVSAAVLALAAWGRRAPLAAAVR